MKDLVTGKNYAFDTEICRIVLLLFAGKPLANAAASKWIKIILGLSLVLNVFLGIYVKKIVA